jgi:hypothetical protein
LGVVVHDGEAVVIVVWWCGLRVGRFGWSERWRKLDGLVCELKLSEGWRKLGGSVILCLGEWERCRDLLVEDDIARRRVINQGVIALT